MSSYKTKHIEEDSRSSEGIGEVELDEEGFYSYRDEDSSSVHQTWSPFEDLDDSGHFTASPDGERALSGSSRSHSPCCTPSNTTSAALQMQPQDTNSNYYSHYPQQQLPNAAHPNKPLISPRSVMTVKKPPGSNISSILPNVQGESGANCLKNSHEPSTNGFSLHSCTNNESPTLPSTQKTSSQSPQYRFSQNCSNDSATLNDSAETETAEESSAYLRGILENFNSLYMEKLKMLDDLVTEGNEEQRMLLMEKKTNMLETWAKDVCVQNMVLVHTVEELEREANRKVSALQKKITESTQAAKEHMIMIKKYEEQVKLLLKNHSDTEEKNLVLKIDLEKLKNECKRVKDRMNFLLKDNESLITLVCRIRDMGVWDVSGLELQRASFDQIFGLYPNLVGGEVQTVFTRDKARRVQETEEKVAMLEKQLVTLQQSQKESESVLLQKDRRIEELETDIKNISNRAQYCEQECNDYKKSLLETQEKLLEATRRLNSSSKQAKPTPIPGVTEMTELIKELRDVKSQLNTAVEEKVTAKEESNFFKRELSERLKEMHDIQNVFQSLATEVVNSRTAFMQVQEKEVQLQTLKSEVQTYQSRCADAEDTIRKKEKEIKQLQTQMNEIHKRSKDPLKSKASSTGSMQGHSKTTSENHVQKFYDSNVRNVTSPSKIPVRKAIRNPPKHADVKQTGSKPLAKQLISSAPKDSQARPSWNTNFKNSKAPPELPKVSKCSGSNLTRSQASLKIASRLDDADDGIDVLSQSCKEVYDKLTELGKKLSQDHALSPSLGPIFESSQTRDTYTNNLFKLPKLEDKIGPDYFTTKSKTKMVEPKGTNLTKNTEKESRVDKEKFPPVKENSTNITKRNGPAKKMETYLLKNLMQNQRSNTPRLNELITAVVETSKQLLGTEAGAPVTNNKDISTVSITAAHYRKKPRNKESTEARRVKSSDKNAETNRGASAEEPAPVIPTKFHSSTEVNYDATPVEQDSIEVLYEPPQNVQEFLAGLPQASQDDIVKNWIKKSNSNANSTGQNKKSSKPKSPIASEKRTSVKVLKHLATRRCPRQKSASSESGGVIDQNLNAQMFELEDEWGKVFANLECKVDGTTIKPGQEKVEKVPGSSSSSSTLTHQVTQSTHNLVESSMQLPHLLQKQQHQIAQESESKCQQQEPMQELLDRLAKERLDMEERFRKELQDKDVELKMQKVTIQHLQDAYVALKRGQPIPVPQNVTGNKIIVNGASNGHTHQSHHNNPVLDV